MRAAPRLLLIIAVLSLAGVALSSVSLAHHYGTSQSSFCDLSETLNCDIVNRSEYSTLLGIPVALIGILGYSALFVLATRYRRRARTPELLFGGALAGLGFALYLTYIEGFVLSTWCILCVSSLGAISSIALLSFVLVRISGKTSARANQAGSW
ncbi:MAG: vitamin K epoxide reductase family protein [Acidobacteria bacterium]|nr:vitamin K epoxide reductase family protein [Acidobacteriota bacterium]